MLTKNILILAAAALTTVSAAPAPAPAYPYTTTYPPSASRIADVNVKQQSAASTADTTTTTTTVTSTPSKTVRLTGVTHTVAAGRGGLKFDPDNVIALVGDVVEWRFLPKNHSIAQSSFDKPCQPQDNKSFSGGFFPVAEGQSKEVFQVVVEDTKPIWYYCAQNVGRHCQSGMVGVINQKYDSPFTLAKHKELAAKTNSSSILPNVQGGKRIADPNPLSGL